MTLYIAVVLLQYSSVIEFRSVPMLTFHHWLLEILWVGCSLELCIHILGHVSPAPEMHESALCGTQAVVHWYNILI